MTLYESVTNQDTQTLKLFGRFIEASSEYTMYFD